MSDDLFTGIRETLQGDLDYFRGFDMTRSDGRTSPAIADIEAALVSLERARIEHEYVVAVAEAIRPAVGLARLRLRDGDAEGARAALDRAVDEADAATQRGLALLAAERPPGDASPFHDVPKMQTIGRVDQGPA